MRRGQSLGCASILVLATSFVPVQAAVLITAREAKLPNDDIVTRGVFSGPKVVLVSPRTQGGAIHSPVDLTIQFEPRGGVAVDFNSLSVVYKKQPPVDLTERVKAFVTPAGITMPSAEVPPGRHTIEVEVKDADGRIGGRDFTIDVAP